MELNIEEQLGAVERTVSSLERDGQPARAVRLARTYATTVDDLWDAVTSAERIARWFLPVTGDLEFGGRYQLEGNAGGTITHCERPSFLALTWEFGGEVNWVEVRLADADADGGGARLALTHTALLSDRWLEFGPGAVGVGWEMGLLGMDLHLTRPSEPKIDDETFHTTPQGKALLTGSSEGWYQAAIAAGTDPEVARAATKRTTAFYTGATVASA
ncbi:MAG: SRPBCC domain-containing protein [Gammaproteobacteria bacterium]|nr:SRPBCC domain-containing protein [Gammaproteobacteria bacterium]MDE0510172.1 SRPBCC domain-containing protein [Gammaproteobacteria bacterium]